MEGYGSQKLKITNRFQILNYYQIMDKVEKYQDDNLGYKKLFAEVCIHLLYMIFLCLYYNRISMMINSYKKQTNQAKIVLVRKLLHHTIDS